MEKPGAELISVNAVRIASDPVDLYRAGQEARLAANVGEANGDRLLAFEDTGAYRLDGLAPGTYYKAATPQARNGNVPLLAPGGPGT